MDSVAEKSKNLNGFRICLLIGARLALLGFSLVGIGCVIFPVPSVFPDYEAGIIDDDDLESLIGLHQDEVHERIGWPDYLGPGRRSRVMIYQGEKHYSTEVYAAMSTGYVTYAGKIDDGTTVSMVCYLIEIDASGIVYDYDVIARPPAGIQSRENTNKTTEPISDCSELAWTPDERNKWFAAEITRPKQIMLAEKEAEDRRVKALEARAQMAELEARARDGDREAVVELAGVTGDVTPLKSLAESGDTQAVFDLVQVTGNISPLKVMADNGNTAAAYVLYNELSLERETIVEAWKYLCMAASGGDANAQAEVGYWHRAAVFEFSAADRLEWVQQDVGIKANNRIAYMWYTLAASNGNTGALNARDYYVASNMEDDEIAQAERSASTWTPGSCPSAEHTLASPGAT